MTSLRLLLPLLRPLMWLLGALGLYGKGRADANTKNALNTAKATVLAERMREETDDDIQQDTGLADRAKRIGLQRPDGT